MIVRFRADGETVGVETWRVSPTWQNAPIRIGWAFDAGEAVTTNHQIYLDGVVILTVHSRVREPAAQADLEYPSREAAEAAGWLL